MSYRTADGWGTPLPAVLDSEQTLVLASAAPEFGVDPSPFTQLAAAFPRSVLVG